MQDKYNSYAIYSGPICKINITHMQDIQFSWKDLLFRYKYLELLYSPTELALTIDATVYHSMGLSLLSQPHIPSANDLLWLNNYV